jgi:hypothetical protein
MGRESIRGPNASTFKEGDKKMGTKKATFNLSPNFIYFYPENVGSQFFLNDTTLCCNPEDHNPNTSQSYGLQISLTIYVLY